MTETKTNRTVEETVIALHEEGWQVPNIASIARVKPDVVKQILRDKKGVEQWNRYLMPAVAAKARRSER